MNFVYQQAPVGSAERPVVPGKSRFKIPVTCWTLRSFQITLVLAAQGLWAKWLTLMDCFNRH